MVSRKLIESEIWKKPPLYTKVWLYLLCRAQHKKYKRLEKGQIFTSIPELQEACSWYVGYRKMTPSKSQIFQVLEWLRKPCEQNCEHNEGETMITTTRATHGMVINIENYCYYQDSKNYESNGEPNNENSTKETRTERQPNNINKNVKNDKNNNNIKDLSLKVFNPESKEMVLATKLRDMIKANNEKARVPQNLNKWAYEFDKMIRIDKRDPKEIWQVMVFSQKDSFWSSNILSPKKLREKYDQLYLKMGQRGARDTPKAWDSIKEFLEGDDDGQTGNS